MAVIKEENYHDEQNKNNILKLRKVLDTLPPFCRDFFRGIEPYTSTRTRLAYAYDIRLFFEFLHETNSFCKKREITELPLSVLDMVQRTDIEEYLDYMSLYQKDGKNITNEERGKARKLAALRSFYNYYFQSERIEKNTAALVPLPKRHEKEIIRLEPNEVAILLDQVEDGTKLTKKELENKIATFTGGRAAEEVVFGEVTTGASNDIEQATKIARSMITRYGMSDDFDMVAMETVTNQYLGGDASLACSADTQNEIDRQVVELVRREHEKAKKILMDNRQKLDELSNYLYEKETITGDEFMAILKGNEEKIEVKEDEDYEKTV